MAKIFISYKRNTEPDTPVATAVHDAFCPDHDVFIDTEIQVGEKWADVIQRAIKESDYFICFLSASSVHSEMVIAEIETAYRYERTYGKPSILPVRLNFEDSLVYPLSAYLNPLQWAIWETSSDTPKLILDLKKAVSGGKLSVASTLFSTSDKKTTSEDVPTAFASMTYDLGSPEGTMPHQSSFYIERETDKEAIGALNNKQGVTVTIKGPRQMGKSSLLNRLILEAKARNMRTAFVDFQLIENSTMETAEVFYKQFCSLLSWEFEIEDRTDEFWKIPLGQVQKTTSYLQKHLLKEIKDVQILLAMDEVERMFGSPFRSDFFSMLRSWHNNRARGGEWVRLNLSLVTSTEPYQFISDLNQSPFNVGQVVELVDFTLGQINELNHRHRDPLSDKQLQQLYELLCGHPYLTRRALYLIASGRITYNGLNESACEDNGPFGDHLRNHLFRMSDQHQLKAGLVQVLRNRCCLDDHVFFQLRGAGLVKRVANDVIPRNPLYEEYFKKRLNV